MTERPFFARRTGAIFLGLVIATNFLPWMELLEGETATAEFVSAVDYWTPFVACFLAAVLVFVAWMAGRRSPVPANPRVLRPRLAGLRLVILSAGLNLILVGIIWWLGAMRSSNPAGELKTFAVVWCLLVLPTQILAAFLSGRSSYRPAQPTSVPSSAPA